MNNMMMVFRKDLILNTLDIESITWEKITHAHDTRVYDNVIYCNGDGRFKILKCRQFGQFVNEIYDQLSIMNFITTACMDTENVKMIKELSELAKKYKIGIVTEGNIILSGENDPIVLEKDPDACVTIELHRKRDGSSNFVSHKLFYKR